MMRIARLRPPPPPLDSAGAVVPMFSPSAETSTKAVDWVSLGRMAAPLALIAPTADDSPLPRTIAAAPPLTDADTVIAASDSIIVVPDSKKYSLQTACDASSNGVVRYNR
jgi:hypothetical protein